uniref:DNA polymerase n=1 Tax=Vitrella brassicaformis TaxID=1169539 RepID=A0A7S1PBA0_9ALVE|mmetsp:Transcript_52704/g.132493  ORF Transcript_52704/g.132493 Transcript_52704/m.132493 type:complete len:553 (+) Transcript_52704:227-1885(+)
MASGGGAAQPARARKRVLICVGTYDNHLDLTQPETKDKTDPPGPPEQQPSAAAPAAAAAAAADGVDLQDGLPVAAQQPAAPHNGRTHDELADQVQRDRQEKDNEKPAVAVSDEMTDAAHAPLIPSKRPLFDGIIDYDPDKLRQIERLRDFIAQPQRRQRFACQREGRPTLRVAENKVVWQELDKLSSIYGLLNEKYRSEGFRKAASRVLYFDEKITESNVEKLRKKRVIGDHTIAVVKGILRDGKSARVAELTNNPVYKSLISFQRVWGIGYKTAEKLFVKGVRTLGDLRKRQHELLTSAQRIGLQYVDEFEQRMDRREAEQIIQFVADMCAKPPFAKHNLEVVGCGSYRRGKSTCGDVDVLILRPPNAPTKGLLAQLVGSLHAADLLTDDLHHARANWRAAAANDDADSDCDRETMDVDLEGLPVLSDAVVEDDSEGINEDAEGYFGVGRLPGRSVHRRIDIKIYPRHLKAFALLYFTGSAHFNRSMRFAAKKMGMALDDKGIYPCARCNGERLFEGLPQPKARCVLIRLCPCVPGGLDSYTSPCGVCVCV